ncbi:hypothetical protein M426DRAFT_161602 [Hypoxylon sp. CI-4A]|nr:hypothetical protein M426DRAFT_161602 [Hypoxylon sp. CI-4A]
MPSATPFEPPMLSPSKKRRREDEQNEVQVSLYGLSESNVISSGALLTNGSRTTTQHNDTTNLFSTINNNNERFVFPSSGRGATSLLNMPRKAIPLPVNKRFRLVDENEESVQQAHLSQQQQQQSYFPHAHPEYSTPPSSPQSNNRIVRHPNPAASLSPCHICHRKPTKKSDLDSFADCAGCGQRACFVCIRACQGWLPAVSPTSIEEDLCASFTMQDVDDTTPDPSQKQRKGGGWIGRGHREMVCSRCCVERGPEGDIVCLGCLSGMEGV